MDAQQGRADEEQELLQYEQAARELKTAQALEAAEFIRDLDAAEEAADEDAVSSDAQDAPVELIADESARRAYWQAQALVEIELDNFASALTEGDLAHQRSAYYRLAVYHGRTLSILRTALSAGKEALA